MSTPVALVIQGGSILPRPLPTANMEEEDKEDDADE
jgi:hypothetical protein